MLDRKRREFITLLGSAVAAWPLAARAQQAAMPVVGFIRSAPAAPFEHLGVSFRQGLNDTGFIHGKNVAIEYRYADNQLDRLPVLAADLIRRDVAVIVANAPAAEAARAATASIPIVAVSGDDLVESGLVTSLNRPGGNITGVTFFAGSVLNAKRIELLHELVPNAAVIAVLGDPNYRAFKFELRHVMAAARAIGRQIVVVTAASEEEFESAFTRLVQAGAGAMLVSGSPFFTSRRDALVALAKRHTIPAIYDLRELVVAGGLISYSASITDAYRQAGVYAGRILNGEKPGDLPVQQATKLELVINLQTARALRLEIPPSLLARADEVIE